LIFHRYYCLIVDHDEVIVQLGSSIQYNNLCAGSGQVWTWKHFEQRSLHRYVSPVILSAQFISSSPWDRHPLCTHGIPFRWCPGSSSCHFRSVEFESHPVAASAQSGWSDRGRSWSPDKEVRRIRKEGSETLMQKPLLKRRSNWLISAWTSLLLFDIILELPTALSN